MRFIKFNDSQIDSFLFMELSDLAKTLIKNADYEVEYAVHSYLDQNEKKVYVSHFWNQRAREDIEAGMKSDVYLRSIGSQHYTDHETIKNFFNKLNHIQYKSFAKQLFSLCEDLRIEEICKKIRPGTKEIFEMRRKMLKKHLSTQLTHNLERSIHTDALFCALFGKLTAESPIENIPPIKEQIDLAIPYIESQLVRVYEARNTRDIVDITLKIMDVIDEILEKDMLNTYFFLSEQAYLLEEKVITFDEMKRKPKLDNDDHLDEVKNGDEDLHDENVEMRHRETSTPTKSFLQFDLEHGTKTNLLGEGLRDGEDGDQAMGVVQGSTKQAKNNDYSKLEALESIDHENNAGHEEAYGKENKYAIAIHKAPIGVTAQNQQKYNELKNHISSYQKKLKQMIQKTLEHKKTLPRTDLHFGRLNKKLLRMVTDENPRLFYKKNEPSHQIDAVFTLLVDCSASMYDKMEQTKLGITLFHEALKSVQVYHQVVGFWEDTNEASPTKQPNYFHSVIPFEHSLKKQYGPEILQLQPEEDNRDGFAIRHATKQLKNRSEIQKFLLVFSDGEPAAMGYEQNGIIDTHEAVGEARKLGIEVINIFLSNGPVEESQQKTIQNIYGKYSILVPVIEELPDVLFPLLKKLLQKSIF